MPEIPTLLTTRSEDAPKASWDFWRQDDTQIDTFDDLVNLLAADPLVVAQIVVTYANPGAVPPAVMLGAERVLRS